MKLKIFITTLISVFILTLVAQTPQENTYVIKWKGVEKWYAGSNYSKFITFENANYPSDNRLPYFTTKIPCDSAFTCTAELKNLIILPLSSEELELVDKNIVPSDIQIKGKPCIIDGKNYLEVQVFSIYDSRRHCTKITVIRH